MFLVNLQRTPYDPMVSMKVYAKTDKFMQYLMKHLGITEFNMTYDHAAEMRKAELEKENNERVRKLVFAGVAFVVAAAAVAASYLDSRMAKMK